MVTMELIKQLRTETNAGMMDCKKALIETSGDLEKAKIVLRKKGLADGAKRSSKVASEGSVGYYIHAGGKIGVLLEVNCETDFSSKSDVFQEFVKDVAMHIAAAKPEWTHQDDVPKDVLEREKAIISAGIKNKPPMVVEKIATGKLNRFFKEHCLLDQTFVKDPNVTIRDLTGALISQIGEKVVIKRFSRFALGEE